MTTHKDNLHYKARSEGVTEADIKVGSGASVCYINDRYAATVVAVKHRDGRVVEATVQEDTIHGGNLFTPDPEAPKMVFTLRKDGFLRERGKPMHRAVSLTLGCRDSYYCREI